MATGGRPSLVLTSAPMRRKGAATRSMGRDISDASPIRIESKPWPASRPVSSRIEVPELPRSSAAGGALRPPRPDALDAHPAGPRSLDADAHGGERSQRGEAILAFQESVDLGRTLCDGTQHGGAMRNRLVPGNPDVAGDPSAGNRDEAFAPYAHGAAASAAAMAESSRSFCAAVPVEIRRWFGSP